MSARHIVLVDDPAHGLPGHTVVPAKEYLTGRAWSEARGLRVVNLCRDTQYHSPGYYASLLAEARGHRVVPSVRILQDLSRRTLYGLELEELEKDLDRVLARLSPAPGEERLEVVLFFGRSRHPELRGLARAVFEVFPVPILRVELRRKGGWHIASLRALGLSALGAEERPPFEEALHHYLGRKWLRPRVHRSARYDLAILHDPEEALPPSDRNALAHFIRAARALEMDAELITRRDFARLGEYDALFIRETTAVNHHTYRFARKAASEGLVVIDDPDSILRCTNKIFLAERLARERISTPRTVVMGREDLDRADRELGYPMVLKIPDGSFSRGVFKVRDRAELDARARALFKESELLLAQAYTFTPFDWRVGVLAGEPLFVCRYHMSPGHWQILDHAAPQGSREGAVDTLAVADAPERVVRTAVRAARLMGDGLYGVDLKETEEGVLVIEVNDNPNIDAGVEDRVLGPALYQSVMAAFLARLDARTRRP
ncbi:MAG: RimK family protein [Longimicrobiales bacterium]|nr:RimK family protein [Longimicrobiales bacterium]